MPTSLRRHIGASASIVFMLIALSVAALAHAGSVYVPVDSWVYPAAERLAVLTGAQSEVLGMRPWTRAQFAHFLERAKEKSHNEEAKRLQRTLEHEFAPELNSEPERLALESIYTRSTQIGGTPLRDTYHFGQTIVNDFGRPYGQGFNSVDGGSGYVQDRAGLLYVRGEYQHGASLRSPSQATLKALLPVDGETSTSTLLTQGGPEVNNPRLLDTYAGVSFGRFTGTIGKQSLWWGPAAGGAMLYSNNIEPIWMARLTNDRPYKLPILGNLRLDMFYGKVQGHKFIPHAWIHGEKISVQPFKDFQIGFSRTDIFLGDGFGATPRRIWDSYFSVGDTANTDLRQNKPGDRRGGLDFSWKLPAIPVTLYTDSFCEDDRSPLANPFRATFHPGLYVAQLPGPLAKFDLRMEGAYTTSENRTIGNGQNYWNGPYKDGYTNKGLLIGDPVGRDGVEWQAWTTYWISPLSKVQVSYRNHYISPKFIKGGGTQNDVQATTGLQLKHNLEMELGVQSERYIIPLLTRTRAPQYDVSGWAGITYSPEHKVRGQ